MGGTTTGALEVGPSRPRATELAELAELALLPVERDDRFDRPSPAVVAASATLHDQLVGHLGGSVSRHRLQLDALVADGVVDGADALGRLWRAVADGIRPVDADVIELWGRPARTWHREVAETHGFEPVRTLHQMRCRLPLTGDVEPTGPFPTRAFDPERDLGDLREVNNRAFASHPDQGGQSLDDLRSALDQPWFRAEGLRIHERDGRMAGFCWTKIHRQPPSRRPDLGEIYVIGVDPDFHGRGLGRPMTAAGLHWLHQQGLTTAMLYVEADNDPAVATYRRLGFTVVRTDRAWARPTATAGVVP